jgi:GDPmannose 4,6-dehydratase
MNTQHPYDVWYITMAAVKIAMGLQEYLYTGNLSAEPDWGSADNQPHLLQGQNYKAFLNTTTRDFIRIVFAELGIEIEFSGKNHYEKGVIIDIDEDRVGALGLNAEALKFGQTVVKVDPNHAQAPEYCHADDALKLQQERFFTPDNNLEKPIKEMLYSYIKQVKKTGL